MDSAQTVISVDERGVATLTLARPEKHNAFDEGLIGDLAGDLARLRNEDRVRALVLTASGKSFSAGADLEWMRRTATYSREQNVADAHAFARLLQDLANFESPTIARVQGAAYGGGVGLAACCDIIIASDRARFCLSEVRLGLIPAVISPHVCAAIGARAARRYALTAEVFDAQTALDLGLVHEVVPAESLDAKVDEICCLLLDNAPGALVSTKRLIGAVAGRPMDESLIRETAERIADQRASPEGREGVDAFLNKRSPAWRR